MGNCVSNKRNYAPTTSRDYEELIGDILRSLNAHHCMHLSLNQYICLGVQDSQYSPNMTIQDKINLVKLKNITSTIPIMGHNSVKYYLNKCDFRNLANNAEKNMIRVLDENQDIKQWFISYDPPHYMFNSHPMLHKLSKLVDSDGHSGASFAMCCQSIRRKLTKM